MSSKKRQSSDALVNLQLLVTFREVLYKKILYGYYKTPPIILCIYTAMQKQKAVSASTPSKQILPFLFICKLVREHESPCLDIDMNLYAVPAAPVGLYCR